MAVAAFIRPGAESAAAVHTVEGSGVARTHTVPRGLVPCAPQPFLTWDVVALLGPRRRPAG